MHCLCGFPVVGLSVLIAGLKMLASNEILFLRVTYDVVAAFGWVTRFRMLLASYVL